MLRSGLFISNLVRRAKLFRLPDATARAFCVVLCRLVGSPNDNRTSISTRVAKRKKKDARAVLERHVIENFRCV